MDLAILIKPLFKSLISPFRSIKKNCLCRARPSMVTSFNSPAFSSFAIEIFGRNPNESDSNKKFLSASVPLILL